MSATAPRLHTLKHQRPEWEPWLRIVEVALRAIDEPAWRDAVPDTPTGPGGAPRLARATVRLRRTAVQAYVDRLLLAAAAGGTSEMATLGSAAGGHLDALVLFRASLCQAHDTVADAADRCGANADALQAVAALIPVPFLQACNRAWSAMRNSREPYCPVCGSWPAFAEVRGIERSRHHRCGRCGSEWHAHGLSCPFCATADHRDLVRLVPGDALASSAVEACRNCRGYLKTFNRLQGCAPAAVLLEDLGSVALDVAALEGGYSRPAAPGHPLDITIAEAPARGRFLAWKA